MRLTLMRYVETELYINIYFIFFLFNDMKGKKPSTSNHSLLVFRKKKKKLSLREKGGGEEETSKEKKKIKSSWTSI